MNNSEILVELDGYREELSGIDLRFKRGQQGPLIDDADQYRFSTIVQEIRDLLKDHVPGSDESRRRLAHAYAEGTRTFTGTSSLHSVREIGAILDGVRKRVYRLPQITVAPNGTE